MPREIDEHYMKRCFDLALQGRGAVKTNPMVGAVIVSGERVIGEGYHKKFGDHHAEKNAIMNVSPKDRSLLPGATMYVSLEPCNHHGKTPPCADLILRHEIAKVVVSNEDPNPTMQGKSLALLAKDGIEVASGILAEEGAAVNCQFFINQRKNIPFIVLKWAESSDGFIGKEGRRIPISHVSNQFLVHKWRSELDGIMVATNTAVTDNPQLNNRLYPGKSPVRILMDPKGIVSTESHLLQDEYPTWIYSNRKGPDNFSAEKQFILLPGDFRDKMEDVMKDLYQRGIGSVLVEGGRQLLQNLIDRHLWHEARIIRSSTKLHSGIASPSVSGHLLRKAEYNNDKILIISNLN